MAEKIEASPDAIRDLVRGINNSVKQIHNLSEALSSQLRTLGTSFQDEGFITIQKYISNTQKKVAEAVPDLEIVMKKLLEYAQFIDESRSALNNGGVIGSSSSYSSSLDSSSLNTGRNSQNIQAIGSSIELKETQQTWTTNSDGTTTFDTPVETGQILDSNQGKVAGFGGTCGLVSCVNVLRMAGINATEQQAVSYASRNKLCETANNNPDNNGGTSPSDRQLVLAQFGVKSELQPGNVENIAAAISEGRGVIAAFDAGRLWGDPDYYGDGHAITITSVKKAANGKVLGFFVCDSGTGGKDKAAFYSTEHIRKALRPGREINVTSIIR